MGNEKMLERGNLGWRRALGAQLEFGCYALDNRELLKVSCQDVIIVIAMTGICKHCSFLSATAIGTLSVRPHDNPSSRYLLFSTH